MTDWLPIKWQPRQSLAAFDLTPVTVELTTSPFYNGVRYAVRWRGLCLDIDGKWNQEPIPSSRDDTFYSRCRFLTIEAAFKYAEEAIQKIRTSGR